MMACHTEMNDPASPSRLMKHKSMNKLKSPLSAVNPESITESQPSISNLICSDALILLLQIFYTPSSVGIGVCSLYWTMVWRPLNSVSFWEWKYSNRVSYRGDKIGLWGQEEYRNNGNFHLKYFIFRGPPCSRWRAPDQNWAAVSEHWFPLSRKETDPIHLWWMSPWIS